MSVFKIVPTIQQYNWGKIGKKSKIAFLATSGLPGFKLEEQAPYAEVCITLGNIFPFDTLKL